MNYKGEISKVYNTTINCLEKKNHVKDKLMLNIWYNEFGLVYFKSISFLKDAH